MYDLFFESPAIFWNVPLPTAKWKWVTALELWGCGTNKLCHHSRHQNQLMDIPFLLHTPSFPRYLLLPISFVSLLFYKHIFKVSFLHLVAWMAAPTRVKWKSVPQKGSICYKKAKYCDWVGNRDPKATDWSCRPPFFGGIITFVGNSAVFGPSVIIPVCLGAPVLRF